MANEETDLIFGVLLGRFTFIFRCDLGKNNIENTNEIGTFLPLDDSIDTRNLGEHWAVLNNFGKDEERKQNFPIALWGWVLTEQNGK